MWTSRETDVLFNFFGSGHAERAWEMANARVEGNWLQEQKVERYEFLEHLGAWMNALFTSGSGGRRWVDQSPVNTFMPDLLIEMFAGAKFLHMLRDGRLVVHSMISFGCTHADAVVREEMIRTSQLPTRGRSFTDACDAWRMFTDTAMGFATRRPGAVLTVHNEELVADPDAGFARIFDFLELENQPESAAFFRQNRIHSSFAPEGARAP